MQEQSPFPLFCISEIGIMQASFQKSMHSSKMAYDKSEEYNSTLLQSLPKDLLNSQIVILDFVDMSLKSHPLLFLFQFAYEHQLQRL